MEFIPLAEEYSLSATEPPKHFIGKTLVEVDLRKRFQVTVIATKDVLTDQFIPAPPASDLIKDSEVLILIGKTDDVDRAVRYLAWGFAQAKKRPAACVTGRRASLV